MRFLSLFLLLSCSLQTPLKYKYNSSKRYLASLTREDAFVAKITGEVKNQVLFASGMDSTFVSVKLYDEDGNIMTDIDPTDLTLSSSEDVEAKPFVMKQGVYKAEILPRVKSRSISMRVDWQEKVMSPEIVLKMTIAPLKNELKPLSHEYYQSRSIDEISVGRGSATAENATDNFSFENIGDNKIVDANRNKGTQRNFHFDYSEQARQNLAMMVDDSPNSNLSQTMHSLFMFFPRKNLFVVEQFNETINVTLTNGEKMIFHKESKEIMDGVFTEGPVDPTADRNKRQYADLKYQGRGVVLRVNTRGQSPQLGQFENVKIDMEYGITGAAEVLIINGATGQRCRRPKADFWEPLDVSPIEFKFPTDAEFNLYLNQNCGFGLPKL
jgi:hypothetical protein